MKFSQVLVTAMMFTPVAFAAIEVDENIQVVSEDKISQQSVFNSSQFQAPSSMMTAEGWVPFVGAGFGYMDRSGRHETEGVPGQVKLLGSYYYPQASLIGDLALGFEHQSYSQDKNGGETTQALLEAALRYEFSEKLSAGVVLQALSGQAEKIGSDSDQAYFWGVQVAKEFSLRDYGMDSIARVGMRLSTDINIPGDRVNVFMIEGAIGFPNFQKRGAYVSKAPAVKPPLVQKIVLRDLLKDPSNAHFEIDSYVVSGSQSQYLARLAQALNNNPDLVEQVYITGHADDSGSSQHNMELSKRRAQEVARTIQNSGVSSQMIRVDWKGETLPLNPLRRDENRRVEVRFIGVRDEQKLDQVLRSLE